MAEITRIVFPRGRRKNMSRRIPPIRVYNEAFYITDENIVGWRERYGEGYAKCYRVAGGDDVTGEKIKNLLDISDWLLETCPKDKEPEIMREAALCQKGLSMTDSNELFKKLQDVEMVEFMRERPFYIAVSHELIERVQW